MSFEPNSENARRLLRHFEERRASVLSLTRALCEIESPSGDGEGSRSVVNLLAETARTIPGVKVERESAHGDYGEHLILRTSDDDDARTLLLLGHTDTVHPRGTLAARPWREEIGFAGLQD